MVDNPWAQVRRVSPQAYVEVWWLSPMTLNLCFVIPIYGLITCIGFMDSSALMIRTERYLTLPYVALGLTLLLLAAAGSWFGQSLAPRIPCRQFGQLNWKPTLAVLGLVVFCAYLYWFRSVLFSPTTLLGILTGSVKMGRHDIGAHVGVTSFVNWSPVFFALFAHAWARERCEIGVPLKFLASLLVLLTLLRVYIWGERIAAVEIALSLFVPLSYAFLSKKPSHPFSRFFRFGPYAGLPAIIVYFAAAEYFRSWQSEAYYGKMDFASFALGRFATYYYTALNNGAGVLSIYEWPTFEMRFIAEWLFKAPFLIGPVFRYITQPDVNWVLWFLDAYADPEFNNPSGIFMVIYDLGLLWGGVYFFLFGFLGGVIYRSFLYGRLLGVLVYPLVMMSFVEIYRYVYFGSSRFITALLGVIIAYMLLNIRVGRETYIRRVGY